MASYSTYNILKAAADGLADAINYRTNLKRKRRENEYDYQRDLQRQRDEEAYNRQRDLQWGEEDYRIKHDRELQAEKEKIARRLGYLGELPQNVDLYDPSAVNVYNDQRDIYGFKPVAVQKKEKSFGEQMKEKQAMLDMQLKKQKDLIDYQNAHRPKSVSNAKPMQQRLWEYRQGLKPEEQEAFDAWFAKGGSPRAVKGGNGAVMDSEWDTPYAHSKEINPAYGNVVDSKKQLLDYLKSKGFKQEVEVMDKALDVLFDDYPEGKQGEEKKAKVTEMFNNMMSRLDKNDQYMLNSLLNEYQNNVAFLNGLVSEKTNGRWGYSPKQGHYNVEQTKARANAKGTSILDQLNKQDAELSKVNPTTINPSTFIPVTQPTPPAVINNTDQAANLDAQRYLRGEMTAAQFQMLHPNYPLPMRQY